MPVWVEQIPDEEGGGFRTVENGREIWETHDQSQAEQMANRVMSGEFASEGIGTEYVRPAAPPARPPPAPSRGAQSLAGSTFDTAAEFALRAEELALKAAELRWRQTEGDEDQARAAYTSTLAFIDNLTRTYGYLPPFDVNQLHAGFGARAGAAGGAATNRFPSQAAAVQFARGKLTELFPNWAQANDQAVIDEVLRNETLFVGDTELRSALRGELGAPGAPAGAGPNFAFLGGLQNLPTLQGREFAANLLSRAQAGEQWAREFVLKARAMPDILGSIRAEAGLRTEPFSAAVAGLSPDIYSQALRGFPQLENLTFPTYREPTTAEVQGSPRFQQFLQTPFVQAIRGLPRAGGEGAPGADVAVAEWLPRPNEIPYTTFRGFGRDEQAALRALYPGLTESAFASPFVQAVSGLPRVSTATRYA